MNKVLWIAAGSYQYIPAGFVFVFVLFFKKHHSVLMTCILMRLLFESVICFFLSPCPK